MELEAARTLAHQLMDQHGITERGWVFDFSQHPEHFGQTVYNVKSVLLSEPLTAVASVYEVEQTILHEIAHVLTPKYRSDLSRISPHGSEWQTTARRIGYRGEAKAPNPNSTRKIAGLAVDAPLEIGATVTSIDGRVGIVVKTTRTRVQFLVDGRDVYQMLRDGVVVTSAATPETIAIAEGIINRRAAQQPAAEKLPAKTPVVVTSEGELNGVHAIIEKVNRTRYVIMVPETGKSYYAHFHLVQAA